MPLQLQPFGRYKVSQAQKRSWWTFCSGSRPASIEMSKSKCESLDPAKFSEIKLTLMTILAKFGEHVLDMIDM